MPFSNFEVGHFAHHFLFLSFFVAMKRIRCHISFFSFTQFTTWFLSSCGQLLNSRKHQLFCLHIQNATHHLFEWRIPVGSLETAVCRFSLSISQHNGNLMPPFIFPHVLNLNTEVYIKCLEEIVPPWIKTIAAGRSYVWQQDSAPCHTHRRIQSWLSENFCNHIILNIWLPNSPDCNHLYFYVLDVVERETNKTLCNTKDKLKARITALFTNLNKEIIGKSCRRFQSCLEAIVEANHNFF